MDLVKTFGVDRKAAECGKWFPLAEDGSVKVARLNNAAFKAEAVRLQKPHLAQLRVSRVDNVELLDRITIAATAKTILLDWKDITINGEVVPYSVEKAIELLTDYPDFREAISLLAVERENFTPEDIETLVEK